MTKARSREVTSLLLHRKGSLGVVAVAVVLLAGCAPTGTQIDDLRERFVAAGGACTTWTSLDEPRARQAILCDSGAKLYTFTDYDAQKDVVKTELEVNRDIRGRTHIMLSGEDTLIIDRIGVIVRVMPYLHGIIQGRNGANP
ncbi:MAG: hypothetical protein RLZ72_871 [Actinomycetota bacterium]|jgi:hypothetical protein